MHLYVHTWTCVHLLVGYYATVFLSYRHICKPVRCVRCHAHLFVGFYATVFLSYLYICT